MSVVNEIICLGFYAIAAALLLKAETAYGMMSSLALLISKFRNRTGFRYISSYSIPNLTQFCFVKLSCCLRADFTDGSNMKIQPPYLFDNHELFSS